LFNTVATTPHMWLINENELKLNKI
jgi:hypothetical protein